VVQAADVGTEVQLRGEPHRRQRPLDVDRVAHRERVVPAAVADAGGEGLARRRQHPHVRIRRAEEVGQAFHHCQVTTRGGGGP